MKKKRITLLALVLAFVFSLSVAVLAACSDDDRPAGDGTAVKLVTDDSLEGKLLAMYTFEDTGDTVSAIDPFTGEALAENNGTYGDNARLVTNPKTNGGSTTVLDTDTTFRIGAFSSEQISDVFEDYAVVDGNEYNGISFSFWAYNNETLAGPVDGGESADWANLATNGFESINWGNLTHMNTGTSSYTAFYPAANTVVGRGAYTEESYEEARQIYSDERLALYEQYYNMWNAVAGNTQAAGSTDNEYVLATAAAYLNNWRYITVNVDLEEGLSFYNNGRLAFRYTPSTFITAPGGWEQIYVDFVMGAMAEYQESDDSYIDFFGAEAGIYADDLIVGLSLTEEDACNLYESVSGTTWDAEDLELRSALSDEEAEKDALSQAYLSEQLAAVTTPVEGDLYGAACVIDGAVVAGVERVDTDGDGVIDDTVYDARTAWLEADHNLEEEFIEVVGSTSLDNGYKPASSANYYIPEVAADGTFSMTVSGIIMTPGVNNWESLLLTLYTGDTREAETRIDNFVNYTASGLTVAAGNMNISWPDVTANGIYLNVIQRFAKMDAVFAYDGTNLTITYNLYYYFAGETVELTLEDGTTFEYTIPKDSTTLFNTITYNVTAASGLGLVLDMNALSLKLGTENSAYLVEAVTGGEASATAPESDGVDPNALAAAEEANAAIAAARQEAYDAAVSAALNGGSAVANLGSADFSNTYGIDSTLYAPASGDTWEIKISGFVRSNALSNYTAPGVAIYIGGVDNLVGVLRGDRWINAGAGDNAYEGGDARVAWATTVNGTAVEAADVDWADWTATYAYSKYDLTISFDGTALTVTFSVEATDKGAEYSETVEYTDRNGAAASVTMTAEASDSAWVTTATITDAATIAQAANMRFAISTENCYYTVTSITGIAA